MKGPTALLFAPLPPPVGGITSITAMLDRELRHRTDVLFRQPVAKTSGWMRVIRPIVSIGVLVGGTLRIRHGGRVVFFCSSRASFWDKCVWAAVVLALGRSVVMVMVAGDFPEVFARAPRVARAMAHWLFRRRGLRIAAQSASWAAVYREIFPRTPVMQVGATVDPEFFDVRREQRPAGGVVRLLFVGWIIEDKGILELLDAVELIRDRLRDRAQVRLVGPMFGKDEFWRDQIVRRDITEVVELAGAATTRAAILDEYRCADAFVFPSRFEGFPVALLEATAAGLPCVATDVGGVSDMLDHGRAGIVVPVRSVAALAAALDSLVTEQGLRERLGAAAAAHARRVFSRQACLDSYERALGID